MYTPKHIHYQDSHSKMHDHKPHTMFWPWHMLREFERCKVNGWVLGCAFHKSDPMVYNPYTAHVWSHIFRGFPYITVFFLHPFTIRAAPSPKCYHASPCHASPSNATGNAMGSTLSALNLGIYPSFIPLFIPLYSIMYHDVPLHI